MVYAFLRGETAEEIADAFPALNLERTYGAIAYYLANRSVVDTYLEAGKADFARLREESRRKHPALYAKLEAARHGSAGVSPALA